MTDESDPAYTVRGAEWVVAERLHGAAWGFAGPAYESEFDAPTMANLMKIGDHVVAKCDGEIRDALR